MNIIFDGAVCFDRFGACYHYYTQLAPRLVRLGCRVTITPSPTGALAGLGSESVVLSRSVLPGGNWIPPGRLRRFLSRQKTWLEGLAWSRSLPSGTLFQSFYYGLPPRPNIPLVGMVLDLIAEKFPQDHSSPQDDDLRRRKELCISQAVRIIVISESTRDDLCRLYSVDPERVDVVPLAVDPARFEVPISVETRESFRKQHSLSRPFLLQVGGRQKHKNFLRMLEAFARLKQWDPIDLVCAGESWGPEEKERLRALGLGDRVKLVRRPDDTTLCLLYRLSEGLVYPSLYEGFGIPPLEAMASGVPVAAANRSSIPKTVGNAALLFDPLCIDSMARAMEELRNPEVATRLREAGRERVRLFSWDRVAEATFRVYGKALGQEAVRTSPLTKAEVF